MGRRSFQALSPNQKKKSDELKRKLCARLKKSMARPGWTASRAAARMGTSRAVVSHINRGRVDKLTFSQLFRCLIMIEPMLDIIIGV